MENENEVNYGLKMMDDLALIRGTIINAITLLERMIDIYLAHHFAESTDKRQELMQHVFATKFITFESKRLIFNKISSLHNGGFKETDLPGIHARLDEFNTHRNHIAHCVVDSSINAELHFIKTKEVTLLKYLHKIEKVHYTVDEARGIANKILAFMDPVYAIINFSVKA